MDPITDEITAVIEPWLPEMLDDLAALVNMDSPSEDKESTDKIVRYAARRFCELTGGTATAKYLPRSGGGDHVKLEVGSGEKQVLILGHLDTVWSQGESLRRPFRVEGERAFGPGVFDMKCGIVQGFYALRALIKQRRPFGRVVLLLNTDEEIGSPTSKGHIEEEARRSEAVYVLEPAFGPEGKLKTARKGVARYKIEVHGVAAHSGTDHELGRSAIEELARQIIFLHGLTDYGTGTTVNVGVIEGGTRANVVSDRARGDVDVRCASLQEAERLDQVMGALRANLEGVEIFVEGGITRPPMTPESSRALFARAQECARKIGFSLESASVGGGSDGSFTAALNIPTLDGLGAVGGGAHALTEFVSIPFIPKRAALFAELLSSWAEGV